jgi:hypothetical protein
VWLCQELHISEMSELEGSGDGSTVGLGPTAGLVSVWVAGTVGPLRGRACGRPGAQNDHLDARIGRDGQRYAADAGAIPDSVPHLAVQGAKTVAASH